MPPGKSERVEVARRVNRLPLSPQRRNTCRTLQETSEPMRELAAGSRIIRRSHSS
jgi:hypothetical protein